ncbi:MAG: DUF4474 domain-containing protein [Oscillospiraceae bacterium]|jgi:hypothetical protein|nr:DUF4474 domain-containing protein [Oscillospiraceae bacterium]
MLIFTSNTPLSFSAVIDILGYISLGVLAAVLLTALIYSGFKFIIWVSMKQRLRRRSKPANYKKRRDEFCVRNKLCDTCCCCVYCHRCRGGYFEDEPRPCGCNAPPCGKREEEDEAGEEESGDFFNEAPAPIGSGVEAPTPSLSGDEAPAPRVSGAQALLAQEKPDSASPDLAREEENDSLSDEIFGDFDAAGFVYDKEQEIFYSKLSAWQKELGYGDLYDDIAANTSIIFNCEPIFFDYDGKTWRIELWKGQYGITAGAEIGVYLCDDPAFMCGSERIFRAANEEEYLPMSFELKKDGRPFFKRSGTHWWLTGFKLGAFVTPKQFSMDVSIGMLDSEMAKAFTNALYRLGYTSSDIFVGEDMSVRFSFTKPHSAQPMGQGSLTAKLILLQDRILCKLFNFITAKAIGTAAKLELFKLKTPFGYKRLLDIKKFQKFMK